jgi:tetratricopeptide (TPR) repeat protein
MNKENVLFGIIGLLAGLIIGFIATNSYNRSVLTSQNLAGTSNAPIMNQQNQGAQNPGGMMPGVNEAIEKADQEPANFAAQVKAGEMFGRINNFEKALVYFERAHQIKPDDYQTIVILGNVSFEMKKFAEAQKWYEQALARKSDDVNVRTDLGLTYFLREPKDIDRAIKEYQTSLSINPNHEATLQNLAVAYSERKDAENLRLTLAKLEKVNPSNQIIQRLKEGLQ